MTKKQIAPCFYFSLRSPYSWIAFRLLEEQLPVLSRQLEYIPFWEPDAQTLALVRDLGGTFPYTPMSKAKHRYILQDIKRLTARLGLPIVWPVDKDPWWDLPHLAYLVARRLGRGHEFLRAAYRCRWEGNQDICSALVIRQIAGEIDVDAEVLAAAPDTPDIRAEGARALYQAYHLDVFGIPFFTYGREKFWGVDRLQDFAQRIITDRADILMPETIPSAVVASVGCYDTDCVGGCG